jgi:hypothetical protein
MVDIRLAASLESSSKPDHDENDSIIRTSTMTATTAETTTSESDRSLQHRIQEVQLSILLWIACLGGSILLISWEDISMNHPMRREIATTVSSSSSSSSSGRSNPLLFWGTSTIKGMAFGRTERQAFSEVADLESESYQTLPSYNEVMLQHRVGRIAQWDRGRSAEPTNTDVKASVRTIQMAMVQLLKCKELATNYDFDALKASIREPIFRSDFEGACYVLKRADKFLSQDIRNEIGFDWGSCAWRHCGALADAQEALDELDHLIGILEPYECLFCLDIVERSLRDILAVTKQYHDPTVPVPDYQPIQRMSDVVVANDDGEQQLDGTENDYLNALSFLRNTLF